MAKGIDLPAFMRAVDAGDRAGAIAFLEANPTLPSERLKREDEFFAERHRIQLYDGDSALHVAAFSYNHDLVNALVACGADVHARNRRGAQPLHAAAMGTPGTESWKPLSQAAVVRALVEAGADPDAKAAGGVTPLHRAVRNRCSDAVRELLVLGANPQVRNENDSTPMDLVHATSGRSGSSSAAAKEEQRKIERLLWTLPPTS